MSKLTTEMTNIDKQIAELKAKQVAMLDGAKTDTKKQILELLKKNSFELSDIFPDDVKRQGANKHKIAINGVEFSFVNKVSNKIKDALKELKLNPEDYTNEKLVSEFGI